mmetsp:Transcript_127135/g.220382  ORF Transcript_127135/g.220382 Transcript_127135/m.220382 type:complete len:363 (-) Transcript_127135:229-1317(-)
MHRIAFVLTCLAYAGHGRRLQGDADKAHSELQGSDAMSRGAQAQVLGSLLLAFNPGIGLGHTGADRNPSRQSLTPREGFVMRQSDKVDDDFNAALSRFAPKSELRTLRERIASLEGQMHLAVEQEDYKKAARLRDEVRELRSKDPVMLSSIVREKLDAAVEDERYTEAATYHDQILVLKQYLPQFQLAGLWKGSYRDDGDHIVRIAYEGDTLFATKVTGDSHVPAGEITFRADLSQLGDPEEQQVTESETGELMNFRVEVVSLSQEDSSENKREVPHFEGQGRVAAKGFQQARFVPGKLYLLDDDVVGFLWVPLGAFVVFNRVKEDGPVGSPASSSSGETKDPAASSPSGERLTFPDDDDMI